VGRDLWSRFSLKGCPEYGLVTSKLSGGTRSERLRTEITSAGLTVGAGLLVSGDSR